MTIEEAAVIAGIVANADNGCPVCVAGLVKELMQSFTEFDWPQLLYCDDEEAINDLRERLRNGGY